MQSYTKTTKYLFIQYFVAIIGLQYHVNFFVDSLFTSTSKVVPFSEGKNNGSSLTNIAAQFGLGGVGGSSDNSITSSMMIPDILRSRRLASELLDKKFKLDQQEMNLASILSGTDVDVDSISNKSKFYLNEQYLETYKR